VVWGHNFTESVVGSFVINSSNENLAQISKLLSVGTSLLKHFNHLYFCNKYLFHLISIIVYRRLIFEPWLLYDAFNQVIHRISFCLPNSTVVSTTLRQWTKDLDRDWHCCICFSSLSLTNMLDVTLHMSSTQMLLQLGKLLRCAYIKPRLPFWLYWMVCCITTFLQSKKIVLYWHVIVLLLLLLLYCHFFNGLFFPSEN